MTFCNSTRGVCKDNLDIIQCIHNYNTFKIGVRVELSSKDRLIAKGTLISKTKHDNFNYTLWIQIDGADHWQPYCPLMCKEIT